MVTSAVSSANLDVNSIVTQLMQIENRPLTVLQTRQSGLQSKISAYGAIKSAYSAAGDAMAKLSSPIPFNAVKATSSDPASINVTASSKAVAGAYSVEVSQLAQAQKLASGLFAASDTPVGGGTLNIQFGTFSTGTFTANGTTPAMSVSIAPGRNSLTDIRDAINQASGAVRAAIVNDGAGYRLALSSTQSGLANSLKITVADDDTIATDTAGLSQLAYDPAADIGSGRNLTQKSAAADALLTIDGVAVSSGSNTVSNAVDGLTLSLAKTTIGTPLSVVIEKDLTGVKSALDDFVKAYNNFNTMVKNFTNFDPATRRASLLTGDATVGGLLSALKAAIGSAIPGLNSTPSRLTDVGLAFQRDGTLALDASAFNRAVQNPANRIAPLFAALGTPADGRVEYLGAADQTPEGVYAVNITQAATRGQLAASAAAGLTITTGANDSLSLLVDGRSASLTLAPGTYTADALAAELQSRINGAATLRDAGITVAVSQSAGVLSVRSTAYSSASGAGAPSGNAALSLFGAAPTSTIGTDVAGTIGGATAIGRGQGLTTSSGFSLKITANVSGSLGDVSFNRGYAARISALVNAVLKTDGAIASRTDGLNRGVQDLQKQQTRLSDRLTIVEASLRRQYTALDGNLSRMNTTSTYLTQQLAQIQANN